MAIITSDRYANPNDAARYAKEGKLVRLAWGLYSDEITKEPEQIVRENWLAIVAAVMPGAVITDRSAFAGRPADGHLFVSHSRSRPLVLPGLTILPRKGLPAQDGDTRLVDGVYLASEHRALIDNTAPTRSRGGAPRATLTRDELHDHVVRLTTTRSPERTERLIAAAREYGERTGKASGTEDIIVFFESARGARPTVPTGSRAMQAAQRGQGFDRNRAERFRQLAQDLSAIPPKVRFQKPGQKYQAFFEAYFSNFIEGTEFTVEEAARIALEGEISERRPEDAHDIAGTYRIVNDETEMSTALLTFDDFLDALKRRHAAIMEGRPNIGPGTFKQRNNQAGTTLFVDHELVDGTLQEGWRHRESITDPFARAAYIMFLVSGVHPFTDGNGRTARIMMNGELAEAGYTRIIIPTLLRSEYLSGLAGLTHNGRSAGLISVLNFAQQFTAQMDFSDLAYATRMLDATNAFMDPAIADAQGSRIVLPSALPVGWEFAASPATEGFIQSADPLTQAILNLDGRGDTERHS